MSNVNYGVKIDSNKANEHFNLVMQIKKKSHKDLKEKLKDDKHALRYYCGKDGDVNTDLCFLFSKEIIEDLLRRINAKGAHGVVIFNGVRTENDQPRQEDPVGRPTVMIFPYIDKRNVSQVAEGEDDIVVLDDDGYEHPGTGGKPGGTNFEPDAEGNYKLPTSFSRSEVYKLNG